MTPIWTHFLTWMAGVGGRSIGKALGQVRGQPGRAIARKAARIELFTDQNSEQPVGFNNAHPVRHSKEPGGCTLKQYDHRHRFRTIRPYEYRDAATLLADFWTEVDAVLKERGVIP